MNKKTSPYLLMHRCIHKLQTYGCRANNPDICGNNGLLNIYAFSSVYYICKKPSQAWKKEYNKLKG